MIIYVIDEDYPIHHTARHWPGNVKALLATSHDSHNLIFSRVFSMVYEPVELLRIGAHMNSGRIGLGDRLFELVDVHWFELLRDIWKAGGKGIELHGCGVASDTGIVKREKPLVCQAGTKSEGGRGQTFLQAVADAAGTQVTGALNCQQADKSYNWEGPTVTCKPVRAYPWKGPVRLNAAGKAF